MPGMTLEGGGIEFRSRPGLAPPARFQIVGQRCSGTNFVDALIGRNLRIERTTGLGWKHGFPAAMVIPEDVLPIVVFRDPFDWIRSLYRKPWHFRNALRPSSFEEFATSPVDTVMDQDVWSSSLGNLEYVPMRSAPAFFMRDRVLPRLRVALGLTGGREAGRIPETAAMQPLQADRDPLTGELFPTPFAMRRAKSLAFLGYSNRSQRVLFLQYEAVKRDPAEFIAALSTLLEVAAAPSFEPVEDWLGGIDDAPPRSAPDLTPRQAALVLALLDGQLESRLGYGPSLRKYEHFAAENCVLSMKNGPA